MVNLKPWLSDSSYSHKASQREGIKLSIIGVLIAHLTPRLSRHIRAKLCDYKLYTQKKTCTHRLKQIIPQRFDLLLQSSVGCLQFLNQQVFVVLVR